MSTVDVLIFKAYLSAREEPSEIRAAQSMKSVTDIRMGQGVSGECG